MVASVKAELAVPLTHRHRVVGVLNAESTTPIGEKPVKEIERVAALLTRGSSRSGRSIRASRRPSGWRAPPPAPRRWRTPTASSARPPPPRARSRAWSRSSSPSTTAHGGAHVHHAAGPLADVLSTASAPTRWRRWRTGWSPASPSLHHGRRGRARAFPATEPLRRAGAGALVVVPLAVGGAQARLHGARRPLERRAGHRAGRAAGAARRADRRRSCAASPPSSSCATARRRTPSPGSATRRASIPGCRASAAARAAAGRRVAVLLAEVDGIGEVNDRGGHAAGDEVLREMAALLGEVAPTRASAYRIGGDEFALILEVEDRGAPQELAWQLQAQARERLGTTVSIGVAMAAKGEPTDSLARARRRGARRGQAARARRRRAGRSPRQLTTRSKAPRTVIRTRGPARTTSPSTLNSASRRDLDPDDVAARAWTTPGWLGDRAAPHAHARRGEPDARPAGITTRSSRPSCGSASSISEPPPKAPVHGHRHLPGAAVEDAVDRQRDRVLEQRRPTRPAPPTGRRAGRAARLSGCARRAAAGARPALATLTNGLPSPVAELQARVARARCGAARTASSRRAGARGRGRSRWRFRPG